MKLDPLVGNRMPIFREDTISWMDAGDGSGWFYVDTYAFVAHRYRFKNAIKEEKVDSALEAFRKMRSEGRSFKVRKYGE